MRRFTLLPLAALVVLAACTDTAQITQTEVAGSPALAVVPPSTSASTLVDFNGIGPVGAAAPSILAGGVTISFSNLEVSEIGATGNGFGGAAGSNQVIVGDRTVFNGQFLTAEGVGRAQRRPTDFVRTIYFDRGVTDVSMYVADMDICISNAIY